jgi:hypothetical protein
MNVEQSIGAGAGIAQALLHVAGVAAFMAAIAEDLVNFRGFAGDLQDCCGFQLFDLLRDWLKLLRKRVHRADCDIAHIASGNGTIEVAFATSSAIRHGVLLGSAWR